MNSISVTHVSSWQLKSELRKKCCGTPKSLIQRGRWYPLLYCCCCFFLISGPFWWFLRLLTITQRKLSTIPLLGRTGIYSQGSQIKSTRSQYRQCYIIPVYQNSTGPWVAKDHSYLSGKRASLFMEPRVSVHFLWLQGTWEGQSATSLPPPMNFTEHSLLWPAAIPQGSLTRF